MKDLTANLSVLCCKQMDRDKGEHICLGHLDNSTSHLQTKHQTRFKIVLGCQSMSVTREPMCCINCWPWKRKAAQRKDCFAARDARRSGSQGSAK